MLESRRTFAFCRDYEDDDGKAEGRDLVHVNNNDHIIRIIGEILEILLYNSTKYKYLIFLKKIF